MLTEITSNIFVLRIPFEEITTTVYIVKTDKGYAIIDSGTYESDVDKYIIPTLSVLGIAHDEIKYLLLTHSHGDHAGGIEKLSNIMFMAKVSAFKPFDLPNFCLIHEGDELLDALKVVHLPGHSEDSVGYLEIDSGTLLSGDCLQLAGVGKYTNGVADKEKYIESMKKLKTMNIKRIVAAHEYVPLGSVAEGQDEVNKYIDMSITMC